MKENLFKQLNEQQLRAVFNTYGPSIILAGAGSGKTRVLVYKVLNLIKNHQIDPSLIVMITFTNKAASEMKERIKRNLMEKKQRNLGYIGTFHSFCARILRIESEVIGLKKDYIIFDEDDQLLLLKSIIKKRTNTKFLPSYFLQRISAAKNQLITTNQYLRIFSDSAANEVSQIYQLYQKELQKNQALDFDDLIMKTVELFKKNKTILEKYQDNYRFLLVDEFQDTNFSQYMLTRLLGKRYSNITVVGDFSQGIYSWRGADISNLEKFKRDFLETKIYYLEENYRSTQKILDFAYKIISKNQTHPVLRLYTKNFIGEEINFYEGTNEEEEALYVTAMIEKLRHKYPLSSFAVLYRINAQSRVIEEAFLHYGIPYLLIGGTRFYERKEIKDILSYLRLVMNPDDSVAEERIKKLGKKMWNDFNQLIKKSKNFKQRPTKEIIEEIFNTTGYLNRYNSEDPEDYGRLENIKELMSVALNYPILYQFLEQVALVESEYFEGEKKNKNNQGVRLMTLHQAKGLEFLVVFIVGVEEGLLPHSLSLEDHFQLEEERRLFYVGITRAKERLYITYTRKRFIFGRRGETMKSRFLEEEIV